ncbi:MAG: tripartite tricarboxylate transporter substrate binding protein [Burkholderiales bacterium]|nr:tripartite tricarboxylate transporter substrate binding protein [Burkholderiales bacterium]
MSNVETATPCRAARMRLISATCALVASLMASDCAHAAEFPAKLVRLVVPFAPGGSSDSVARMIGPKLSDAFGQQVIVDNRPGGNSNIGAAFVARAAPDGYTLLLANANLTVNPALFKTLPYDPTKDFAPVARLANQTVVLLLHPSVPARSVKELVALAKGRPGELNFASPGVGTASHMTGVLFRAMTGIDMVFVPYKGAGPSLIDLIGGQVTVGASGLTSCVQYIDAGRLRALGVTSAKRSILKPDIPTIAEAGIAGFEVSNWFGILAPAGTPAAVVDRLQQQVARIMGQESNQQLVFKLGLEPAPSAPVEFGAFIGAEIEKWLRVTRQMGIAPS